MLEETKNLNIDAVVNALDTYVKAEVGNLKNRIQQDLSQEVAWRKSAIQKVDSKLDTKIQELNDRVGEGTGVVSNKIGDIDDLITQEKNNVVSAINSEANRAIKSEKLIENELSNQVKDIIIVKSDIEKSQSTVSKIADWGSHIEHPGLTDITSDSLLGQEKLQRQQLDNRLTGYYTNLTRKVDYDFGNPLAVNDAIRGISVVASLNNEQHARVQEDAKIIELISNETLQRLESDSKLVKLQSVDAQQLDSDLEIDGDVHASNITSDSITTSDISAGRFASNDVIVTGKISINKTVDNDVESGNLVVQGDTTTNNLYVSGNLVVDGDYIVENKGQLMVADNIITTRAGSTESPNSLSGLQVNLKTIENQQDDSTQNSWMGILYNPNSDSVDLSIGSTYIKDSKQTTTLYESHPIVIRPDSNEINDSNLIIWKKSTEKFVDIDGTQTSYTSIIADDSGISSQSLQGAISLLQDEFSSNFDSITEDGKINTLVSSVKSTLQQTDQEIIDRLDSIDSWKLNTSSSLDNIISQVDDTEDRVGVLETFKGDFDIWQTNINNRVDTLQSQQSNMEQTVSDIQANFDAYIEEVSDNIETIQSDINDRLNTTNNNLSTTQQNLSELSTSFTNYKNQVPNIIDDKIQGVDSQYHSLADEVNILKQMNNAVSSSVGTISVRQNTLEAAFGDLTENFSAVSNSWEAQYGGLFDAYKEAYSNSDTKNRFLVTRLTGFEVVDGEKRASFECVALDEGILSNN